VLVLSSIVSSSHNGEAYLLCYPRSDQQKTLLHWAFLTARPWAEHGSRFTRGLFIFFFLSVTRRRPPLGQTLSHATCDVFPPEAVKT